MGPSLDVGHPFTRAGGSFGRCPNQIALTKTWRVHERTSHPGTLLTLGVLILTAGFAAVLSIGTGSPLRTFAPVAVMVGLASAMVGLAGMGVRG